MRSLRKTLVKSAIVLAFAAPVAAMPALANAAPAAPATATSISPLAGAADGTPAGAVQWYKDHNGSTAWQSYCEKAAENAYGTTGVWASANAHWNGATQHKGDYNPPLGAFVYWATGNYGHVGISDGAGGFYASSVNGAIGHVSKADGGYDYYKKVWNASYRGWTPAAVPSQ